MFRVSLCIECLSKLSYCNGEVVNRSCVTVFTDSAWLDGVSVCWAVAWQENLVWAVDT